MSLQLPEKLNSAQQKIAKPFLDFNIPIPDATLEKILSLGPKKQAAAVATATNVQSAQRAVLAREAEAVLASVWVPKSVQKKRCKNCNEEFQTTYIEAYCSNDCRKSKLLSIGIIWNPDKTDEERWAPTQIPGTIKPETLRVLKAYARAILEIDDANISRDNGGSTVYSTVADFNGSVYANPQVEQTIPQPETPDSHTLSDLDQLFGSLGI